MWAYPLSCDHEQEALIKLKLLGYRKLFGENISSYLEVTHTLQLEKVSHTRD